MSGRDEAKSWQLKDFELCETVGTGTFGRVRLCKHRTSNKFYVLKILKKHEVIRMKQVDHVLNETSILQELDHPFIVTMLKGFMDSERLYLLLEYIAGGELFSHLRRAGKFPHDVAKFYSAEIVLAFEHIHSKGIIYRDLKPENILLNPDGNVKITDFGFAKRVAHRTFTLCGTPEYLAPEILKNCGHDKGVDWWALGILLYEMVVGYPPFFDDSPFMTYKKVLAGNIIFPDGVDARVRNLIQCLLVSSPSKRLGNLSSGAQDVKKHKFFRGVKWDDLLAKKITAPIILDRHGDGDTRYFDKYSESPRHPLPPLSYEQQELFNDFCNGDYCLE